MKLKTLSKLKYRGIYVVISFVLLILVINNWWYFVLIPPYFFYLFKSHPRIMKIIGLLLIIYIFRITQFDLNLLSQSAQYEIKVTEDIKIADYTSFVGRYNYQLVKVYTNEYLNIRPGDNLLCSGKIEEPINNTTPNLFNYKNYLKSQNIKSILYLNDCQIVEHLWNLNMISFNLNKYISANFKYSNEYIKTFILADKSGFDDSLVNKINMVGISHLFAVSGLHISLIVLSLMSIMKKVNIRERYIEYI
ncbi:MAG: ComEC/Rec2 family competence protein [Candidatus Izimaplasma sp.]|nr:ComEC/Rec2 family competence protein [Candidatus Izimaplasma bacterium]